MNDSPSSGGRYDEDAPGSPKRKKVRAKYAPKACVACRRSKLKCSGDNPCVRCADNARGCFYSEDQTAAEVLQNLSRPPPVQAAPPPPIVSNGNGASRRNILPRHEVYERRASEASVPGMPIETRMARIESMMEMLIRDRGIGITPRGSIETDDVVMDGYNGDGMSQAHMDAFAANLVPIRPPPSSFPTNNADPHLQNAIPAPANQKFEHSIRYGTRTLPFPSPEEYQRYLDFFLWDLNTYYPCVDETVLDSYSATILNQPVIEEDGACQLALLYIIFACVDVLGGTSRPSFEEKPAGWQWFSLADDIIDKRKFTGRGGLCLLQCLILGALYLMFADQPNAAYSTIGLAGRLCFQLDLHQRPPEDERSPPESRIRQLQQRLFWVTWIIDTRVSLSCERPYSMQDLHIGRDQPTAMHMVDVGPDVPLPYSLPSLTSKYLGCLSFWPKFASSVWDQVFAAGLRKEDVTAESVAALDAYIQDQIEIINKGAQPPLPFNAANPISQHDMGVQRQAIDYTGYTSLRLLLYRKSMLSLAYDAGTARHCGALAVQLVQRIARIVPSPTQLRHSTSVETPCPIGTARFHTTTGLASALLTLCALLLRDPHDLRVLGLISHVATWTEAFFEAMRILRELASESAYTTRVLRDFEQAERAVEDGINSVLLAQASVGVRSLRDLLPYQTVEGKRRYGTSKGGWDDEFMVYAPGKGVLWL